MTTEPTASELADALSRQMDYADDMRRQRDALLDIMKSIIEPYQDVSNELLKTIRSGSVPGTRFMRPDMLLAARDAIAKCTHTS